MTCEEIKKLLVDCKPQQMSKQDQQNLAEHISHCRGCFAFQQELRLIRQSLETLQRPVLPLSLDKKTRERCCNELLSGSTKKKFSPVYLKWPRVPKMVWAALIVLTVFTLILIAPFWGELANDDPLSPRTLFSIIVISQNVLMLMLAPLLLQRYGKKSAKSFRSPAVVRGYGRSGGV